MELKDIIAGMEGHATFSQTVLEELRRLTEEKCLEFGVEKQEWELHPYVQPGKRTFFSIEDKKGKRAIIGMILVPNPKRMHSDKAWNRIEEPLRDKLSNFERNGLAGETIKCILVQIWETQRRIVLVPLKELNRVREFRDSGDFHIKEESGEFFLQTPRWDENIRLKDRLDDLFNYL